MSLQQSAHWANQKSERPLIYTFWGTGREFQMDCQSIYEVTHEKQVAPLRNHEYGY